MHKEIELTQLCNQEGPEDDAPVAAEGQDASEELPRALDRARGRLHGGLPRRLQRGPQRQEPPPEAGAGARRKKNQVLKST